MPIYLVKSKQDERVKNEVKMAELKSVEEEEEKMKKCFLPRTEKENNEVAVMIVKKNEKTNGSKIRNQDYRFIDQDSVGKRDYAEYHQKKYDR